MKYFDKIEDTNNAAETYNTKRDSVNDVYIITR